MSGPGGALSKRLGFDFTDPELVALALTHRSYCAEHPGSSSNERLEFLGDAVLGLAVADHLYRSFPDEPEGQLAKMRAAVVNAPTLAEVAAELELGGALRLGRGEELSGGRGKPSILANALEAVIGAVHLDGGWPAARSLVLRLLAERIEAAASLPGVEDYKTRLQELVARRFDLPPTYEVDERGPDHDKRFAAKVRVGGVVRGRGAGSSKKQAEQDAARMAWHELAGRSEGDDGLEPGDA